MRMYVTLLTVRTIPTTLLGYFFSLSLLAGSFAVQAADIEMLDTIRLHAQQHALAQIDETELRDPTATAGKLDSRLQLKKCSSDLETFSTGSMNNVSRMTVGVRCTGQNPWTLYVPVTISATVDVVFSSRALTRGSLLSDEDIETRRVSLDKLPIGYISDSGRLANFELIRPVRAGTPLTLNAVRSRKIVQQGQEVIIVAQTAGIQVRMTGEALKNGNFGDLIPVKNLNSGRTVEATILSDSTVSVNL
tara:strand:+ start:961 stop:1704 length:744 start_codon:yes stop_codon:yes gene_type:complete